jgi:hypothetical protein
MPTRRHTTLALALSLLMGSLCAIAGCDDDGQSPNEPVPVIQTIGEVGVAQGQFSVPRVITSDGVHPIVIDKTARVQMFDPETGRCLWWFRMPEWAQGKPVGARVLMGPEGEPALWVADTHYHRVMVYALPSPGELTLPARGEPGESKARLIAQFGSFGRGPGEFIYPTDIAVLTGPDGKLSRVFVSEYGENDRVSVFDANLKFISSFGSYGTSRAGDRIQFQRPQSMVLSRGPDGKDELLISDSINHRLGRFTLDGQLIAWLGASLSDPPEPSNLPGRYNHPRGIALLGDGTALVAEFGNNRVQRIDAITGEPLGAWGHVGRGPGEVVQPWSVCVIGHRTYVLDTGNHRVLVMNTPRKRS